MGTQRLDQRVHVALEDNATLLFRGETRKSHNSAGLMRGCRHSTPGVSSESLRFGHEVLSLSNPYQLRSEVKQERCLKLSSVLDLRVRFEDIAHVDLIEVVDAIGGGAGERHQQRLQMRLITMSGDDDELGDTVVFPSSEQLVYGPVESFSPQTARPGEGTSTGRNPVGERGRPKYAQAFGNALRHVFCDADVRPQRQVRTVLIQRTDNQDQARISCQGAADFRPTQLIERE